MRRREGGGGGSRGAHRVTARRENMVVVGDEEMAAAGRWRSWSICAVGRRRLLRRHRFARWQQRSGGCWLRAGRLTRRC